MFMKYTVITGASSGIGYETALSFASLNKNLIIVARRKENLVNLQAEIKLINPALDVVTKVADLSVIKNVYNLYEDLKAFELETWINNAGFGDFSLVADQNLAKIEKMLHLNIEALTILSTLFVHDYKDIDGTQLINVSSVGGHSVYINNVTYCATKFYVNAFTEGIAHELKAQGAKMRAKVLAPAATETEFAKHSLNVDSFEYKNAVPIFHTAKQMAAFMLELYNSNKVVGIVDKATNEFILKDPIFPVTALVRKTNQ